MVFSSLVFLCVFLPVVLAACYLCPTKARNTILLVSSLIFYAWGEPYCIFLMMISALVDYIDGRLLTRFDDNEHIRRLCLICALIINLSLLSVFKYAGFAVTTVNRIFSADLPVPSIALPVGISFYTFQTISYSIDVYRRKVPAEKNYFRYLTYVSMFPQLIAGPIVRYETVAESLKERNVNRDTFTDGASRFMTGLFRKVLIANPMGEVFTGLKAVSSLSVTGAWLGLLSFTLQLYFDFSAYSDMAIGLGKMLGFSFPENFEYPLSAVSMTDFWRRWHRSLSSWFRDYVYIPLGGNRRGTLIQIRNLAVVWFLTGLWHGASWNFVLWGLYHGLFLVLEKFVYGRVLDKAHPVIRHIYTLVIVIIGFGIFALDDPAELTWFFGRVTGVAGNAFMGAEVPWFLANYALVIITAFVLSFPVYPYLKQKIQGLSSKGIQTFAAAFAGVFSILLYICTLASLVKDSYNPFLYFRF